MADKDVKIRIQAEANDAPVKKTRTTIAELKREVEMLKTGMSSLGDRVSVQEIAHYDLDKAMRSNGITIQQTKINQAALDAQRARAIQTVRQLREEEQRAAVAAGPAARGTRDLGGAALEASRAFEDAQYGLRGMLNNLPGLVMMLGGSAGLAGVLSIAAVAVSIFAKRVEKMQEEAKKAEQNAGDMTEKLKEFLATAENDRLDAFLDDLENLAAQEAILRDATLDTIETEEFRRDALGRVADALRAAAEEEIKLAQARGQITDDQARAQIAALQTEAEASKQQAEIAAAASKTRETEARYTAKVAELQRIRDDIATLEAERDRAQQRSEETLRRANALADPKTGMALRASDKGELDQLRSEIAAADNTAKDLMREITRKSASLESQTTAAMEIAQALDVAIERERILTDAVNQVAQIGADASMTQATAAVEKVRAGLEAAMAEATARGEQVSQEQRAAFAQVSQAMADGMLTAQELQNISTMFGSMTASQRDSFAAIGVNINELQGLFGRVLSMLEQQKRTNTDFRSRLEKIESAIK